MNILKVGEQEHFLPEVLLHLGHRGRPEDGLMFSLYADPADLQQAGLAINSNELSKSVICEPGAALELMSLRLVFGAVHGTEVPITLDAVCRTRSGASIPRTST